MNLYQVLALERPKGMIGEPEWWDDKTYMLPAKAQQKGMIMLDIIYIQPSCGRKDPMMIFDREGRILYQWSDRYPGWLEVQKVCRRLLQ